MLVSQKKVEVVPYDPMWPKLFEVEAHRARVALGENFIAIHHVGSTSVPGLSAKPKIDMVAEVSDLSKVGPELISLGYVYRGAFNIPLRKSFMLRRPEVKVNFYIFEKDHPEMELMLCFRDHLRSHPKVQEEYQALKFELLTHEASHQKNGAMFVGYTLGKNELIQKILKQTGFDRHRFVFCTHYSEWDKAKYFRQKYFFDRQNIEDPYTWTFNHPDHRHLALYKGSDVIGYAHIEIFAHARAMIRIMAIEESKRNQGHGGILMGFLEKWLKSIGMSIVHVESTPKAWGFYKKNGFKEMAFDDANGEDIALGKGL